MKRPCEFVFENGWKYCLFKILYLVGHGVLDRGIFTVGHFFDSLSILHLKYFNLRIKIHLKAPLTLELDRSGPRLFPVQVELDQYKGLLQ